MPFEDNVIEQRYPPHRGTTNRAILLKLRLMIRSKHRHPARATAVRVSPAWRQHRHPTSHPKESNREAALPELSDSLLVDLLRTVETEQRLPLVLVNQVAEDQSKQPAAETDQASDQVKKPMPRPNQRLVPFPGVKTDTDASNDANEKTAENVKPDAKETEVRVGAGSPIFSCTGSRRNHDRVGGPAGTGRF